MMLLAAAVTSATQNDCQKAISIYAMQKQAPLSLAFFTRDYIAPKDAHLSNYQRVPMPNHGVY